MASQGFGIDDIMGRYPISVLSSIPINLIVGTALGFLSGLGIGGGSLLILWLTLVLNMDPGTARRINLLFFIPSALISGLLRWRNDGLRWKLILAAAAAGCASALLFSLLGKKMDTALLRKLFGFLLIAAGLRELFYRPKKK